MAKRNNLFGNAFSLLKQTFNEWLQDKAPQLGAALAYYTVFSLAPLILVLLAIVGVIFRNDPAGAWDKIAQAQKVIGENALDYNLLEAGAGFNSQLFGIARTLLRGGDEFPKPNGERLREFVESSRESLERIRCDCRQDVERISRQPAIAGSTVQSCVIL